MRIGLVGLSRSGKTTLFNLLTGVQAVSGRADGGRGEVRVGIARVPDPRVDRLRDLFMPKKTTYATFEVVDLAGIERGARSALEARELRAADALLHVVRAFVDPGLGPPDPRRDILDLELELILADLEVVDRRLERLEAALRRRRTDAEAREQEVLRRLKTALERETPLRATAVGGDEARAVRGFAFLSQKPILHCLNLDEKAIGGGTAGFEVEPLAARPATRLAWVSALIEAEVARLEGEAQQAFLADLGLTEPALHRLLKECYALLGLVSFFTINEDEVRAWSVPAGTRAQDAAGTVHSDMARGFIRAEVVGFAELVGARGSFAELRAHGKLRLEGKDYLVRDGEVCHFRFNVGR